MDTLKWKVEKWKWIEVRVQKWKWIAGRMVHREVDRREVCRDVLQRSAVPGRMVHREVDRREVRLEKLKWIADGVELDELKRIEVQKWKWIAGRMVHREVDRRECGGEVEVDSRRWRSG